MLRRTFADPVRDGHFQLRTWPRGLRAIVTVGLVLYVLIMGAAVFSSAIRRHGRLLFVPPAETLPALAVPIVCVAMIVALACLFTAGLHLPVPLRVAIIVVVLAVLLAPVDLTDGRPSTWTTVILAALLPAFALLRWRRSFHWLEFVVSLVLIGHAVMAHQVFGLARLSVLSPGLQVSELGQLMLPVGVLAIPVALLAGAALVEITTSAVTWTVTGVWQRLGVDRRRAWLWAGAALAVLVAGRAVQEFSRLSSRTEPVRSSEVLLGAAIAAAVGITCATATWLADRRPVGDPRQRPDPDELLPTWSRCIPILAVLVGVAIGGQLLVSIVLRAFGLESAGHWVLDAGGATAPLVFGVVTSVVVVAAALVVAARGWRKAALLMMSFATMYGVSTLFSYRRLLTRPEDILAAMSLAAVLVLVVLAARRRLTVQAEVSVAGVLLLHLAYRYRSWFTEPLTELVSLTGVSAAVLVGLLWRILTDHGFTRGDSLRYPQASRVLLGLANAVVGVTFAAQVALQGGQFGLDLNQVEDAGDSFLGFPLVLAVSFAGLSLAASGRSVRLAAQGPDRPQPADQAQPPDRPQPAEQSEPESAGA